MTNAQIIMESMILNKIDLDVIVDTYAGWKRRGYKVKSGEKAAFKTKIWKPTKQKKQEGDEEEKNGRLYLVNAAFFTKDQVEEVTK